MASGPFPLRPTIQPFPAKPAAERPLSPWAARYGAIDTGPDDVFNRTPVEHSGYAPDRKCRIPPLQVPRAHITISAFRPRQFL